MLLFDACSQYLLIANKLRIARVGILNSQDGFQQLVVWVLASTSTCVKEGLINALKGHSPLKMMISNQVLSYFVEKVLRIHVRKEHALHVVNIHHHSLESL